MSYIISYLSIYLLMFYVSYRLTIPASPSVSPPPVCVALGGYAACDSGPRLPSFLGEGVKSLKVFPALRPHLPRGGRSHPSFQARPRWLSGARGHEAAIALQRPLHCVATRKAETRQLFSRLRHIQPSCVRSCGRLLSSAANQSGSEMTQGPPSGLVQANGKVPKLLQGLSGCGCLCPLRSSPLRQTGGGNLYLEVGPCRLSLVVGHPLCSTQALPVPQAAHVTVQR